jgi:hypothetical protein
MYKRTYKFTPFLVGFFAKLPAQPRTAHSTIDFAAFLFLDLVVEYSQKSAALKLFNSLRKDIVDFLCLLQVTRTSRTRVGHFLRPQSETLTVRDF